MSQKDKEGILFSTEEMNNIMAETMKFSEDKPETIFGMTFKNAEERRAYFREELRKKLPELKKIEGFPIVAMRISLIFQTLLIIPHVLTHGSTSLLRSGRRRKLCSKMKEREARTLK